MLVGLMLFYVGATLGINGIWLIGQARVARVTPGEGSQNAPEPSHVPERHMTFIQPGEIAVINFFTAGIGVVTAIVLITLGAIQENVGYIANAAFIMLFGFTYLFVALNQLMQHGDHAFGWFCLFIAITAVPIGIYILSHADGGAGLIWLGLNWLVWAVLWFCFFLMLTVELNIVRGVGWFTVCVAVGTAWALGYSVLQGYVTL